MFCKRQKTVHAKSTCVSGVPDPPSNLLVVCDFTAETLLQHFHVVMICRHHLQLMELHALLWRTQAGGFVACGEVCGGRKCVTGESVCAHFAGSVDILYNHSTFYIKYEKCSMEAEED